MNYKKLSKKALWCMYMADAIGTIIAIGILYTILHFIPDEIKWVHYILIGAIGLLILFFVINPSFRYKRYHYLINEECIIVIEGFLWIEKKIVPIERLHIVAVNKGPIDRIFGLSKVVVTTAGGNVTIRFLEDTNAEYIADTLKTRINTIVKNEVA